MTNNLPFICSIWLWAILTLPYPLASQTFTDLPGPLGTTRTFLKGPNGETYLGSSSKGVFRSMDNGQSWTGQGGNTIMTGRINDLLFDANGQLVAATEQGGIKTWNGTAWVNSNIGLSTACNITIPIRSLTMDASGVLFAGAHAYSACFPKGDVYRLDSSGWTSISSGLGNENVNSLAIHPLSGHLFAGTEGGVFEYDGNGWINRNAGLPDTSVHKLLFAANGDLYAGTNKGLARFSANAWKNLTAGLNLDPVQSIALDFAPNHLLIGTGNNIDQVGTLHGYLWESEDGGDTWAQVSPDLHSTVINDLLFIGNQQCLAAGWGIFRSVDNGQSWSASNNGFSGKTFNSGGRIAVTPAPHHALFYGSDEGLFRSLDEGVTWTLAGTGLTRHIITLLKSDHFGNLFCGAMRYLGESSVGFGDGMLYKSSDNGDHWTPVAISKDWRYMEMSELPDGRLICAHGFGAQPPSATILGSSLALSTDHGDTWTDLDVKSGMAFCCAANAAGDFFVAGESQSVYRSTDGGNSFDLIVAPGQSGNVGTLEVSPTGDILMGSGGQRTLFFSTDNGSNYSFFNSPVLPDYRGVSDVIFDHLGTAYCTTPGQSGSPSLFTIAPPFTANSTFNPVSGLAGSLFKMTWDECGYLYIYRAGGVLKSNQPLNLPQDECTSAVESLNTDANFIQASPNPATETIHIKTDLAGPIALTLWNMKGQKTTETQFLHEVTLNISSLPKGIYFLQARALDGQLALEKIILE